MKKSGSIQRGQAITFRLPSDTPDHIIKELQKLKETERRNFSSKIAGYILEGVSQSVSKDRESITIPLPKQLNKEQRNWVRHSHSEALLGTIVYQLLEDPMRATTILASLNSHSTDINEALYLQDRLDHPFETVESTIQEESVTREVPDNLPNIDEFEIDLLRSHEEVSATKEVSSENEDEDDLLDDFLAQMNK
ncbi:hypothetical protein [Bacillus solitudinis]|uniref:hypothetical protein n=1 Tax=Bacillus solitudinis TaxID=2014074 RepID=UPI000C23A7CD|nr:hypothetical protein [Bacillus solitudinis]